MARKKTNTEAKIRLSVPFSPEVYARIEKEANLRGVSMPTYVAFIVGDHIANKDRANAEMVSQMSGAFAKSLDRQNDYLESMPVDKIAEFGKALGLEFPIQKK